MEGSWWKISIALPVEVVWMGRLVKDVIRRWFVCGFAG